MSTNISSSGDLIANSLSSSGLLLSACAVGEGPSDGEGCAEACTVGKDPSEGRGFAGACAQPYTSSRACANTQAPKSCATWLLVAPAGNEPKIVKFPMQPLVHEVQTARLASGGSGSLPSGIVRGQTQSLRLPVDLDIASAVVKRSVACKPQQIMP